MENQRFSDQRDESCGKFLNRFKDYQPEIDKIKNDINMLKDELKENIKNINDNIIKLNKELKEKQTEQPTKTKNENQRDEKYNFLNDISKPKNLKPVETKTYKPENQEYKELKDILRRRREDIEPDETEDLDDEDWGEGIKDKVIKFKALMKMLN